MFTVQILSIIILAIASAAKEPILALSLDLTSSKNIETTFAIGSSEVRVRIDLNYESVDICCKNKDTLMRTIYYFMVNPFKQTEDYHCKNAEGSSKQNDTAKFSSIGPININFNEVIYPSCSAGRMGFNKRSEFLSLMPVNNQFYIISQENQPERKGFHWRLVIGGTISNQFNYLPSLEGNSWRVSVEKIQFNEMPFFKQTIKLISNEYKLAIPTKIYDFIQHELISNFECIVRANKIYCPCTAGISASFPKFQVYFAQKIAFRILQTTYLNEKDEICSTILSQSSSDDWEINILLFDNADLLFDYEHQRIGLANHHKSIEKNELINQPLQIMLNCAVILLMCFFVAMVLIELIKYLIGIEDASNESFQTYMLKRAE